MINPKVADLIIDCHNLTERERIFLILFHSYEDTVNPMERVQARMGQSKRVIQNTFISIRNKDYFYWDPEAQNPKINLVEIKNQAWKWVKQIERG